MNVVAKKGQYLETGFNETRRLCSSLILWNRYQSIVCKEKEDG